MCQVALDRAASIGDRLGLSGPIARWRSEAADLRNTILTRAWNEEAQTLSEHLDGDGSVDASLLALPLRGVIPADHPKMVATTAAIGERLSAGEGLLYRYLHDESPDGLAGDEGAFLLLQLLACREPRPPGPAGGGPSTVRVAVCQGEPAGAVVRADRPVEWRAHRELPAGIQPHRSDRQRCDAGSGDGDGEMIERLPPTSVFVTVD
jgi:hypothetical protein